MVIRDNKDNCLIGEKAQNTLHNAKKFKTLRSIKAIVIGLLVLSISVYYVAYTFKGIGSIHVSFEVGNPEASFYTTQENEEDPIWMDWLDEINQTAGIDDLIGWIETIMNSTSDLNGSINFDDLLNETLHDPEFMEDIWNTLNITNPDDFNVTMLLDGILNGTISEGIIKDWLKALWKNSFTQLIPSEWHIPLIIKIANDGWFTNKVILNGSVSWLGDTMYFINTGELIIKPDNITNIAISAYDILSSFINITADSFADTMYDSIINYGNFTENFMEKWMEDIITSSPLIVDFVFGSSIGNFGFQIDANVNVSNLIKNSTEGII